MLSRYNPAVPMRRVALLTIFAFGCATVRVPVRVGSQPADAPGVIAPPITELWIESSEEVPAELSAQADAQARAAIDQALAGREIASDAAGATDAVLFVRERAVATTEARQSQQTWAKVGIVASIVLVVAAIVIIAVSSKGSSPSASSGKSGGHATAPKASGPPVSVKPRAVPASPRAVPRIGPVPAPGRVIPPPPPAYAWRHDSPIFIGFHFDFWIPPRPLVLAPEEEEPWYAPDPPPPLAPGDEPPPFGPAPPGESALAEAEPPPPDEEPGPIASVALQLPPLANEVSFRVDDRSFFDGPRTAIQLDLLDRATGRLLWSKAVSAGADPLDPGAVARVLDEAFKGVSWAHRLR